MKNKISLIFIVCFCVSLFLPGQALAKALCFTYDIKTVITTENKDGKKEDQDRISQFTASLGDGRLLIDEAGIKSLFDFRKNRIIYINSFDKSYSDISLFSDIGFRYMEFQNRFFIRDVLNAAMEKSGKGKPVDPEADFDIESLFGITKLGSKPLAIKENKRGDSYEYSFNNQVFVEVKYSGNILTEAQSALFEKFLIYHCYIHPQIRKSIVSKKQLPQYLKFANYETGRSRVAELNLVKVDSRDVDFNNAPADYARVYQTSSKELSSIIEEVVTGKSAIKRLEKEDFIRIADEIKSKGNYFDAMLVLFECGLQTGEGLPEKISEVMSAGGDDDQRCNTFIQGLGSKDKESTEKAIKTLESINRDELTHGYVIDIMIADDKVLLGDFDKAKELFLKVLKANPYIAGVYKDLGDPYHSSYDMVSAWQCWDTARFLYPDHKMLQKIYEYEQWLMKTFPDFFLQ
jgi:hypothetical protein